MDQEIERTHKGWWDHDKLALFTPLPVAVCNNPWWRHQMETFSALLAICAGNSPVPGEFPAQRPVTRSFDVYFDLRPNKCLSKQSWGWWFETLSPSLWRHRNECTGMSVITPKRIWRGGYWTNFLRPFNFDNQITIEYHLHIWQMSPQLSCGDTCQIWRRFG